jgi:hypothetical protein
MLTFFQKTLLGTIAAAAVLLALVVAAKGATPVLAAGGSLGGGTSAMTIPVQNGQVVPGVLTTGDGTVKVKPDQAIISVGAVAQGTTASEAQSAVSARVDQILKKAKDLGIADADVKNSGYQINPQYATGSGSAPRITGYQATQQLTFTLRDVNAAGKALDALVQGDVAANTVSLRFTVGEPKAAQAEARRLAIEDAKSKAAAMAKAAGVNLGRAISISDLSSSGPIGPQGFDVRSGVAGAPAPVTQVPVSDLDVVVRVQVQFELQ